MKHAGIVYTQVFARKIDSMKTIINRAVKRTIGRSHGTKNLIIIGKNKSATRPTLEYWPGLPCE